MLLTMRKLLLPTLLLALAAPAAAPTVATAAPGAPAVSSQQARLGGGFRSARRPSFGSRYRSRPTYRRAYRRPSLWRGILQTLGLAYLFHMLFGWGAGGSPLGLLLIVAFVAWLVTRRRRRMAY
jgi:hypothetical protein